MSKRYWKVDDPLFESLPKFNKIRTQELLDEIQIGNREVKDELILQLLAMCKIILKQYLYKNPALQRQLPDLIGVLTLRTCTWVNDLSQHNIINVQSPDYYWQIVKNEINHFSMDDNPNVTGSGVDKKHCKQYRKGKSMPIRIKLKDDLLQINPTTSLEFEDVLLTLAETEREREIIVLRFQGFTETEIADRLQITPQYINQIRIALEMRYDKYLRRIEHPK